MDDAELNRLGEYPVRPKAPPCDFCGLPAVQISDEGLECFMHKSKGTKPTPILKE